MVRSFYYYYYWENGTLGKGSTCVESRDAPALGAWLGCVWGWALQKKRYLFSAVGWTDNLESASEIQFLGLLMKWTSLMTHLNQNRVSTMSETLPRVLENDATRTVHSVASSSEYSAELCDPCNVTHSLLAEFIVQQMLSGLLKRWILSGGTHLPSLWIHTQGGLQTGAPSKLLKASDPTSQVPFT